MGIGSITCGGGAGPKGVAVVLGVGIASWGLSVPRGCAGVGVGLIVGAVIGRSLLFIKIFHGDGSKGDLGTVGVAEESTAIGGDGGFSLDS